MEQAKSDDVLQAELVSEFGYKQELKRSVGKYTSFALAFSMISITTTIFTLFSQPFQTVGGAAIFVWLPAMVGVLLVALVYGHLAVRLPITGCAYQWSSRLVSPHFGWLTGYNALLATFVGTASISVAFATVFAPDFWSNPTHGDLILLSSGAVVVAVVFNIVSVRLATRVNDLGASAELIGTLGLTAVLGVGLFFFQHAQGPKVLFQVGSSVGSHVNLTAIGLALLLPVYTLAGWEGSADLAEETHDPRKAAPSAMIRAVVISSVAAFFVYAVFAMAIPGNIAKTVNSTSSNPMVAIFKFHFGAVGADLLQVVAFISIFSCLLANVTVAVRTSYSLSRDNMLPLSSLWRKVHPKLKTPIPSTIAVGVVAIAVNALSSAVATKVTGIVSVVLYVCYGSTLLAAFVGSRRDTIPVAPSRYFNLGNALRPICAIGVAWSVVVVCYMTLPAPNRVVGRFVLVFEAAGLLWWLLWLRPRLNRGDAGARVLTVEAARSLSMSENEPVR